MSGPAPAALLRTALGCAVLVFAAALADEPGGDAQLDALLAEYWDYYLEEYPLAATRAGVPDFNDRMPSVAPVDLARREAAEKRFLARSRDLDRTRMSEAGRVNADVFEWVLSDSIGAYELDLARIPFNTFSGFYMDALTAHNGVRMVTVADYEDYLARLADVPRYFDESLANMERGVDTGFVLPQAVIDSVLPSIQAQVKEHPEQSSFYEPFDDLGDALPDGERQRLQAAARQVIAGAVMPAFAEAARYLRNEYRASQTLGAAELPGGPEYYAFQVRRYTTVEGLSPAEIHGIGLAEVARIEAEMHAVIDELEFDGDLSDFVEFLRSDARFYADTADELLKEAAYTAKRIDYLMPGYFGTLPRQSYGVVPVPAEIAPRYATGAYYGAPPGGDRGGAFWINTHALDQRPLYELTALTLHEAVPGHHHQNALAQEMENVPAFRTGLYFSAFGEGWALYSEKLGVEMGAYRDGYEHFGRLSYEMWRACRLVIDTGLHTEGWSRERAMAFLRDHTSLSETNLRAEVDRYISWPGQALAYKLGELEIWRLRESSEKLLGDEFDLREFHDVVLANGALPLAMLEAGVERWIDAKLQAR